MREPVEDRAVSASNAAVMQSQITPNIVEHSISSVTYARHQKAGKADSMAVRYWSGPKIVATEWVCLDHGGFAAEKARLWVTRRNNLLGDPSNTDEALEWSSGFETPTRIKVNHTGEFPNIVFYDFGVTA